MLLRCFAKMLGKPVDQHGVAIVDFQNNGSPGAFVGLARAFEIPWMLICDNDTEGKRFIKQVEDRAVTGLELTKLVRPLPVDGITWERYLFRNGFAQEYMQLAEARGIVMNKNIGDDGFEEELMSHVEKDKTGYASGLVEKLAATGAGPERVPDFLKECIRDVIDKVAT